MERAREHVVEYLMRNSQLPKQSAKETPVDDEEKIAALLNDPALLEQEEVRVRQVNASVERKARSRIGAVFKRRVARQRQILDRPAEPGYYDEPTISRVHRCLQRGTLFKDTDSPRLLATQAVFHSMVREYINPHNLAEGLRDFTRYPEPLREAIMQEAERLKQQQADIAKT